MSESGATRLGAPRFSAVRDALPHAQAQLHPLAGRGVADGLSERTRITMIVPWTACSTSMVAL